MAKGLSRRGLLASKDIKQKVMKVAEGRPSPANTKILQWAREAFSEKTNICALMLGQVYGWQGVCP